MPCSNSEPATLLPHCLLALPAATHRTRHLCVISRQCFDPALTQEAHRQLQDAQLVPLGQLVTEAAAAYYQAAAARLRQKQLDVTAALGSCPPEMNAATAFKVCCLCGGGMWAEELYLYRAGICNVWRVFLTGA